MTTIPTQEELAEVETAWIERVERRCAEIDSGVAQTVTWEEIRARVLGEFPMQRR